MDTIIQSQSRKQSAAEVEIFNRKIITESKIRNLHPSLPKKSAFVNKKTRTKKKQRVRPTIQNFYADTPQQSAEIKSEEEILENVRVGKTNYVENKIEM